MPRSCRCYDVQMAPELLAVLVDALSSGGALLPGANSDVPAAATGEYCTRRCTSTSLATIFICVLRQHSAFCGFPQLFSPTVP